MLSATGCRCPGRVPIVGTRPGRPWAAGGERGSASLELAILAPVLLLIVLGGVQAGCWFFAREALHGAAVAGAQAARVQGAAPGAGADAGSAYLAGLGGVVVGGHVTQTDTLESVTITATGTAPQVIPLPGLSIPVTQAVSVPRERWVTPPGGTP